MAKWPNVSNLTPSVITLYNSTGAIDRLYMIAGLRSNLLLCAIMI